MELKLIELEKMWIFQKRQRYSRVGADNFKIKLMMNIELRGYKVWIGDFLDYDWIFCCIFYPSLLP